MKRGIQIFVFIFAISMLLTSCYSYTTVVGNGPQGKGEVTKLNNYFIYGLVPANISDAKEMAGGATDYSVTTVQTFVNGLVSGLTFGIYTPTTTIVKK